MAGVRDEDVFGHTKPCHNYFIEYASSFALGWALPRAGTPSATTGRSPYLVKRTKFRSSLLDIWLFSNPTAHLISQPHKTNYYGDKNN